MKSLYCLLYFLLTFVAQAALAKSITPESELEPETYNFYLPRADVSTALARIANQTNSQLLYSYQDTVNVQSNALIGYFTLTDALQYILEGTGLKARLNADNVILIEKQPTPMTAAKQTEPSKPAAMIIAQPTKDPIEEIKIQGYAGSIIKSLSYKKYSVNTLDAISKEDFGKFPEQNVAESLQRVTGVTVDRESGEGRYVTVRGFGPEFNTVLYNGRVLASENMGREFSFDVLPTELINRASIYKTVDASALSGGIGSTINLESAKPMDNEGLRSVFTLDTTHDFLAEASYPHFFSLLSYSSEKQGVLLSFNYQKRLFQNDSATIDGWFNTDLSYVENKQGAGDFSNAWVPRNFDVRRETGSRERIGATFVYEALFDNDLHFTLDMLFSGYDIESNISSSANWTHDSQKAFQTVHLDHNNTLLYYQYYNAKKLASDYVQLSHNRPTKTFQLGSNLNWPVNDFWELNLDFSLSKALNENGGNDIFYVAGSANANPIYDNLHKGVHPRLKHQRRITVDQLKSHLLLNEGDDYKDLIRQIRLDSAWQVELGMINEIQAGLMSIQRTKQKKTYKTPWGLEFGGYAFDLPDSLFVAKDISSFLNGGVPDTWFAFDPAEYHDYLWSDEHINAQIQAKNSNLPSDILTRKAYGGIQAELRPGDSWKVTEDPLEFYLMANFYQAYPWLDFSGNMGLRYSTVNVQATGHSQELLDIETSEVDPTRLSLTLSNPLPISAGHNYTHLLPSVNLKFDFNERHLARLGLSKTITRPTLDKLSFALGGFNGRIGSSTASAGNPKLAPYESDNLDLSYEWYYNQLGFLGISGFYKYLDRFVSLVTEKEQLLDHEEGTFFVTRPKNVQRLNVWGLEVAWLHHFNQNAYLPFLDGFGMQLNYTYGDSSQLFDPTAADSYALEGLSDSYNAVLFYDKGPWDARVSYHYRDDFIRKVKGNLRQPEMVENYGQLDLSVRYEVNSSIELFLQGINLLNEKLRTYSIYQERLLEYEESGSRYSVGVRFNY